MKIIYEPKGPAKEYATLGLNLYKGCTHRCRYCYCAHVHHADKDKYFASAQPKENIVDRLKFDCEKLIEKYKAPKNVPEILMSFQGDVYQPAEADLGITRLAIKVLIQHNLKFTILTKGGLEATRDFDLLSGYPHFRYGISLSVIDEGWIRMYEPDAPGPIERIISAKFARKQHGIKTWCSLEPIIDLGQALAILKTWHNSVDHWFLGKVNGSLSKNNIVNWGYTRNMLSGYLDSVGASYEIKSTLKKAI